MKIIRMSACCFLFFVLICCLISCATPQRMHQESDEAKMWVVAPGADAYGGMGNHTDSPYYAHPDIYQMKNKEGRRVVLSAFRTIQQIDGTACGAACVKMALERYGVTGWTENRLCELGHISASDGGSFGSARNLSEYGAGVGKLTKLLEQIPGIEVVESSWKEHWDENQCIPVDDPEYPKVDWGQLPPSFSYDPDGQGTGTLEASQFMRWLVGNLQADRCTLVEWADWDGHWEIIIGVDTMGTEDTADDVLLLADPFDTTDHLQDGYQVASLERFFSMWEDRAYGESPFRLQPYVVVGKKGQ